jgi:hypothetical protein
MKAGLAMAVDKHGEVTYVRLMGPSDLCAVVQMPWDITAVRWCTREFPHEGEHEYNGGPASWV